MLVIKVNLYYLFVYFLEVGFMNFFKMRIIVIDFMRC